MNSLNKVYAMILSHNCGHLLEKAYNKIPLNEFDKIFITDDGSVDNSIEIANSLGVEVITSNKSGYGANVKNGLRWGFEDGADYIVEIHGDGAQFNPNAIIPAKKFIDQNFDFIIGSRFINVEKTLELGIPKPRYYANILLSKIDKWILQLPFTANEKNKNINTVNFFLKVLLSKNFNRTDLIIGVGGGIVGDVIGFLASIYKRGINFITL